MKVQIEVNEPYTTIMDTCTISIEGPTDKVEHILAAIKNLAKEKEWVVK